MGRFRQKTHRIPTSFASYPFDTSLIYRTCWQQAAAMDQCSKTSANASIASFVRTATLVILSIQLIVVAHALKGEQLHQSASLAKLSHHAQSTNKPGQSKSEPLYLTPYITANDTERARQVARVVLPGDTRNLTSYAGFLTVNQSDNSNTFFWLIETTNQTLKNKNDTPLLIYLEGGPGGSLFYSLFLQHGPWSVDVDGNLHTRNTSWTNLGDVLYIDNPVGTGFSFTGSDDGYARNQVQIGWNLYNFLVQVRQLFPVYRNRPLYLTGESYAGKYIPALAYRIHEQNKLADQKTKILIAGLMISVPWSDPENQYDYGPLIYNFGLIDQKGLQIINNFTANVLRLVQNGQLEEADKMDEDFADGLFFNLTGQNAMNALHSVSPPDASYHKKFLARCDVLDALHVGSEPYKPDNEKVGQFLRADIFDTVRHWLPTVYENYRTLIYTGQFDIIVGGTLVEKFLSALKDWNDRERYMDTTQLPWKVRADDAELAGYVKNIRSHFYYAMVRGASHLVSYDQPGRVLDLLYKFIHNETFTV